MTTKGEGRTDAILYAVFLLVCLGSGLLLHILSARSVPGVFKFLVGAVFVLSGVITLPGIFKAAVWAVKACHTYRTEYRKPAAVASLVVVVAVATVAVATITGRPSAHRVVSRPSEPKVGGPPAERVVSLELAGPLALGPNGALYFVDEQRHEVLVRLQVRYAVSQDAPPLSDFGGKPDQLLDRVTDRLWLAQTFKLGSTLSLDLATERPGTYLWGFPSS
jgi:hypothetical protein